MPFSHPAIRLFLFSFLLLFLELALIRWLGSNIFFLSFFSNFILLGSFFGIGIGFLQPKTSRLYQLAPILLALLILFVAIFPVSISYSGSSGINSLLVIGIYKKSGFPIWVTLPFIFLMTASIMASIAHSMSILFSQFRPLVAYRLDILGSLTGIVAFSLLSYFHAAPIFWGTVVACVFTVLFYQQWKFASLYTVLQIGCLTLFLITLAYESTTPNNLWSPYYKIALHPRLDPKFGIFTDVYVNGVPHQRIESMARRQATEPFYFFPYQYKASPENVLIIGAGNGGDVAIALAHGAKHVDAVEIDPMLYKLGRQFNADHPYNDPRVTIILNDGRAFLQQTKQVYDLIIFALTDSITLVSGQSSLRLESYIYTKEAVETARLHLKADGIFSMYGYYSYDRSLWLTDRYANTIQSVFGAPPCVDTFGSGDAFSLALIASQNNHLKCAQHWSQKADSYIAPATDDHPFLYLQHNQIPPLYQMTIALIFLITVLITHWSSNAIHAIRENFDLLLMGMAFLLLETKSIISFALLFGNTWIVNSLVFFGILTLIYLAIEFTSRFPRVASHSIYGLLLLSLLINWWLPAESLLTLSLVPRFLIASLVTFSPVFLANIAFASRFQYALNSSAAFGVNMIGAMIGGLLEYISMITGHQFLLILIGAFYMGAFFINGRRKLQLS